MDTDFLAINHSAFICWAVHPTRVSKSPLHN